MTIYQTATGTASDSRKIFNSQAEGDQAKEDLRKAKKDLMLQTKQEIERTINNEIKKITVKVNQIADTIEIKMSSLENCSNDINSSMFNRAKNAMEKYMGDDKFIKSIEDVCTSHININDKKESSIFAEPVNQFLNDEDIIHSKVQALQQAQRAVKEFIKADSSNTLKIFVTNQINSYLKKSPVQTGQR